MSATQTITTTKVRTRKKKESTAPKAVTPKKKTNTKKLATSAKNTATKKKTRRCPTCGRPL